MCKHGFTDNQWCAHCLGLVPLRHTYAWSRFAPRTEDGYMRVEIDLDHVLVQAIDPRSVPWKLPDRVYGRVGE